jgi:hypothetical protein
MSPITSWVLLIVGFVLPIAHIILSSKSGPWLAKKGSKCPIGSRTGWLVIVLILGPVGWLLYMKKR